MRNVSRFLARNVKGFLVRKNEYSSFARRIEIRGPECFCGFEHVQIKITIYGSNPLFKVHILPAWCISPHLDQQTLMTKLEFYYVSLSEKSWNCTKGCGELPTYHTIVILKISPKTTLFCVPYMFGFRICNTRFVICICICIRWCRWGAERAQTRERGPPSTPALRTLAVWATKITVVQPANSGRCMDKFSNWKCLQE